MEKNVFLFLPNLIGYARIALSFVCFYYLYTEPGICVVTYLLSHYLDEWDGWVARKYNQVTDFGAILDLSTDKITFVGFLMGLCHLYPQYTMIFQTIMMIDICGHWILTHAALLHGSQNHKVFVGEDPIAHPFLKLYYNNKYIFYLFWAGNQVFYSFFYLCHFTIGPAIVIWNIEIGLWAVVAAVTFPIALLCMIVTVLQLVFACRKIAAYDVSKRAYHTQ